MKKILLGLSCAALLAASAFSVASEVQQHPQAKAPSVAEAAQQQVTAFQVPVIDVQAVQAKAAAGDYFGAVLALLFGTGSVLFGMTTLAVDKGRGWELGDYNEIPCVASDIVYEGAAVGDNASNAGRPLVAGDRFVGFAETQVDNSLGAAGAKNVRLRTRGRVQLPITSFDVADTGKAVFASDDDTFTLTQSTNSHVGKAVRFVATGSCIVEFDAHNPPPGAVTELTDSSGGTANDTVAAVEATYVQATIANNFADLAAKVNAILRQMKG